jgi:tetratricopeptide (TPR) repeat protein
MNGYFFTASATRHLPNLGPSRTGCQSLIVCADSAEAAQKQFEAWLCAQPEGEIPMTTRINRVVAAQFVDKLLTEKEPVPIDWPQVARQAQSDLESIPADNFEQGYWVDVNALVAASPDLEALRADLPEDIRSGLNWAEDKQSFFLLSVLTPPPPLPDPGDEPEADAADAGQPVEETAGGSAFGLDESEAEFPELAAKEAAVLIRARNAAVAAWLWRKYAADSQLAGHQIRIDPWFGLAGLEAKADPDATIADCTKAIELNPDDANAYIRRGGAKYAKGDFDGTIADCSKAIELKPDYLDAYMGRGAAKYSKGDLDGAIEDYNSAVELKPDEAAAYSGRSDTKYAKGDFDGAIADATKAIELKPDDAGGYYIRGIAVLAKGDLEGATADFTKAIELKADYAAAYHSRGVTKSVKGDAEGAMVDYGKALELDPKYAWAYHARGCLRYDSQAFTDALVDFRKVIELDSSLQDYAHFRTWLTRTRLGEEEAAIAELQTYLAGRTTGKPDDWASHIGRFLAGQLAEPEFLAAAQDADPETEAQQLCQAYFYTGSKFLFAGDKAKAADYFQKSIATDRWGYAEYRSAEAQLKLLTAQET